MGTAKKNGHDALTVEMVNLLRAILAEGKKTSQRVDETNQRLDALHEDFVGLREDVLALRADVVSVKNEVAGLRVEARADRDDHEERLVKLEAAVFKRTGS